MPNINTQVGTQNRSDGDNIIARAGRQGDSMVSQLHGKYYEQCFRGNVWMGGMGLTAITNAIWTTGTTDATSKGITGIYNPLTSAVNVVVLQAYLGITVTAATTTGAGPFVWVKSTGESALTLGTAPTNCKSLTTTGPNATGSVVKDMSGIAMTGKVNALTVVRASSLCGGSSANFSFVGTAAGQFTSQVTSIELIDGLIIVPPGGVLALMATTTPVAHSAVAGIVWEEVPV